MNPRLAIAPTLGLMLLASGFGGCAGDSADPRHGAQLSSLAGVYAGAFPCSNCPAIAVMLWVRPDGRFFLRQSYVAEDGTTDGDAYALGRWRWDDEHALLALAGAGPERRFAQLDEHRLAMQTLSDVDHVLTREPSAPEFSDRLRLEGDSAIADGSAAFTECLTGLRFEVAPGSGYDELRRQHRRLNSRGPPALTEIEGHIERVTTGDTVQELLVIDQFIVLKPGSTC